MKFNSKIKLIILCIIVCFIFLIVGGRFLIRNDNVSDLKQLSGNSDIVLLMGSLTNRTFGAYDVYDMIGANNIYCMRTHMEGIDLFKDRGITIDNEADIAKKALIELGIPDKNIIVIDAGTESTIDEANALSNYFESHKHSGNLIIVTSMSHSRRAGWIFDNVFNNSNIDVYVSPTPYDDFSSAWWFTDREQVADVMFEYLKLLHFALIEQW